MSYHRDAWEKRARGRKPRQRPRRQGRQTITFRRRRRFPMILPIREESIVEFVTACVEEAR